MSFAVADFADFLTVLRAHPEWQAELRHILLEDELAEIRRAIEQSRAEFEAALARWTARLDRMDEQLGAFRAETGSRFDAVDKRFDRMDSDLGKLKGRTTETWYRDRASGIFGHVLHRVRAISFSDLEPVRRGRSEGVITSDEWKDLRSLDLLVSGLTDLGQRQVIALEVAWTLDEGDVIRAARRAGTIARVGIDCVAAVGGDIVGDAVIASARHAGVAVLREGDILHWPEAR